MRFTTLRNNRDVPEVYIRVGPPGTGKTRWLDEQYGADKWIEAPDNTGKWFDGCDLAYNSGTSSIVSWYLNCTISF